MKSRKPKRLKTDTQKQLERVNEKEILQSQMKANTRNFWSRQSFGAESEVRHISPEEYLRDR
jgi:hypothetical protein